MKDQFGYTNEIYNQIQEILNSLPSKYFVEFEKSSIKEDMIYKRDINILKSKSSEKGIGLRFRKAFFRPNMRLKWRDLSIRYKNNGFKTEIDGIREGLLQWYLYGWLNPLETIYEWIFIDIFKFFNEGFIDSEFIDKSIKEKLYIIKPNYIRGKPDGTVGLYIPISFLEDEKCIKEFESVDYLKEYLYHGHTEQR